MDARNMALLVSHPHPDHDHGGGPGPVESWRETYDAEAFTSLVDPDFDPDDVRFEIDGFRHVAVCTAGTWTLEGLPGSGTAETLCRLGENRLGALLSYGGSAFFAAIRASEGGAWEALEYRGVPAGLVGTRACFSGEDVVFAGSRSYELDAPTEVGLLFRGEGCMTWAQSLGQVPGRVLALDSFSGVDGTRVLFAGGQGLWMHAEGRWRDLQPSLRGEVSFLRCFPSGEAIAGTTRGDVIAVTAEGCRVLARVGPIHTAEQWGDCFYVADSEQVYRVDTSGFERCPIPLMDSVGSLSAVGRLCTSQGRLWLAGSHVLASSGDGREWMTHPVADAK
ncbi:hypothetical protein JGU66_27670 [Myxococcaceae bacterium JPH2]|nr:hypothetical protein [Myxococcaceae bacterium JPH2]